MTFTYSPFASDRDRVRFHIGDTDPAAPIFSDEAITALIAEAGGWREAVISALEHLIALTSQPDFRADWLQVRHEAARRSYQAMLSHKRKTFGMAALTGSAVSVERVDE